MLMTLVAVTSVACFESVGNILVVAMFVVPPATAYLLTDRLGWMVALSVLFAASSAVLGHVSAIIVPGWFGYRSTTTAGMMATTAGVFFFVALLFAPRYGLIVKTIRHRWLSLTILREDLLAYLFRSEERSDPQAVPVVEIADSMLTDRISLRLALALESWGNSISRDPAGYRLTSAGRDIARHLVRSHRLWEQYLVEQADLPAERIHDKAEKFEHITDARMRDQLDKATSPGAVDPHGSPIPPEDPPAA
jgi:manganese/zinc/iron transport system permease protein